MIEWLLYNTLIPLSPILLVIIGGWIITGPSPSFFSIIRDGQLCFYCTATTAVLMRDIACKKSPVDGLVLGGLFILILFSTFIYGVAVSNKDDVNEKKVGYMSILTAITTICIIIYIRSIENLL